MLDDKLRDVENIKRGQSMKFILHIGPVVPASTSEREELRPIFHRTDKVQLMLAELMPEFAG